MKRSRRLFTKAKLEFAKYGPQSTVLASLQNLLLIEMKILGLYSSPTESKTLEVQPNNVCFNKPSKWLWCMAKFKNHYSSAHFGSTCTKNHYSRFFIGIKIPLRPWWKLWTFTEETTQLDKCSILRIFQR